MFLYVKFGEGDRIIDVGYVGVYDGIEGCGFFV
jgi:hypothetical protein